jgi:hypothetical protein
MLGQLIGLDSVSDIQNVHRFTFLTASRQSIPLLPYGHTLKQHRKLCHTALSPDAVKKYYNLQQDAVLEFLNTLQENPQNFIHELRL